MNFTSATSWGRPLAACRTRDHRDAMRVSTVAMSRTQRRKRSWWQKSREIQQEREADAQGAKDDPEP
jgi:hypothetical protein